MVLPISYHLQSSVPVPLSFSKVKISFGPKNAILVGDVRPSKTTSAFKLESLIIGPSEIGRARVALQHYSS